MIYKIRSPWNSMLFLEQYFDIFVYIVEWGLKQSTGSRNLGSSSVILAWKWNRSQCEEWKLGMSHKFLVILQNRTSSRRQYQITSKMLHSWIVILVRNLGEHVQNNGSESLKGIFILECQEITQLMCCDGLFTCSQKPIHIYTFFFFRCGESSSSSV